jgi:hypothetical protein
MSGGKGGSQPSSQTVTQSNLPEYAQPYFERLMSRTESQSLQPYPTYGAPRLADFTEDQQNAFAGTRNLQRPDQIDWASDVAQSNANFAPQYQSTEFQSGYNPRAFTGQHQDTSFDGGYRARDYNSDYTPTDFRSSYQPERFGDYTPPTQFTNTYQGTNFSSGFNPQAYNGDYQPGQFSAQQWNTSRANQYMDPYLSSVLSQEQNLANDRFQEQQKSRDTAAVNAGAFGGSRATIANEVARRGMNEQLDTRQRQALSNAYTSGLGAFQQDDTRSLQAQGMGEGSRQFGGNLGLQAYQASGNLGAEAARQGLTAQQLSDASRQFGSTRDFQTQQAQEAARQFNTGIGLQGFQANQQAAQQAAQLGLTADQYANLSRQFGSTLGLQGYQAGEAARQAEGQQNLAGQQYGEQSRQFGDTYDLQGYQANQQAAQQAAQLGLTAQQYSNLSRQYGADLGLRASGNQINAAQLGMNLGNQQQQLDLARYAAMSGIGGQQQQLNQRSLDIGYQDFMNQRDYDMRQLSDYSSILRGVPVQPSQTSSTYGGTGSIGQNIAGAGLAGLGAYKMLSS